MNTRRSFLGRLVAAPIALAFGVKVQARPAAKPTINVKDFSSITGQIFFKELKAAYRRAK